ncbi:hypothetical protein KPH14_005866 [Odynerus spinipes]|uniref:Uncharacterized protein n=1 Tax=Odynerus spinipes TaxID=1348599 RepID=A0AAD9RC82_9HYME|nr:hypothetical protein KPH14_005866 [Odynerus spinipes]
MYAAAGGASIASRRKQKRLQLYKRGAEGGRFESGLATTARSKAASATTPNQTSTTTASKFAPPQSSQFHTGIDRHGQSRRVEKCQQLAPVSPIQFPISPPPLSLESPGSVTCATNKPNNFPFPPPSILDLRISPTSTPELQCQGAGKVAWQGCNRSSPLPLFPNLPHGCRGDGYKTKQCEAHRRWMKRNRIRDASYCYGSSGEDDDDDISGSVNRRRAEVNAAVNTVLYAGLGATALGLVISFVGTGEKGFLSPELKLIGPSLLCAGLLCCLFRVLLCLCLCRCGECRWCLCKQSRSKKEKEKQKTEARPSGPMQTASLLSPVPQQPATHSSCQVSSSAKGHELLLSPAQLPE